MNKKTMYIIVAVLVVVIIVAGAAAYVLSNNGNGGTTSPTPTPTAAATVVGANTLQLSVDENTTGVGVVTYHFACKNFNTSTEMIRVDIPGTTGNYSYIINAGEQKSWSSTDSGATWTQDSTFDANFAIAFTNYVDKLAESGSTNDLKYSTNTGSITIYRVAVNPTLADSLFATS